MSAELLVHGGTIHTMDPARPHAEALAIAEGRIAAVGSLSDVSALAGPGTRRMDLAGATVLPGFNDAHVHVWKIGQLCTNVLDLRAATSLTEVYREVGARASTLGRGAWIVGRGWNEAALVEGSGPDRAGLDRAAPDNPVALTRTCAHIHAVNTLALQRAGVDATTEAPSGGKLDAARGLVYETAWGLVQRAMPAPRPTDYERWILAGARHLLARGITSATDAAVDPPLYDAYRRLESEGRLPVRMNLLHLLRPDLGGERYPLPEMAVLPRLRCDTVKLFADGGLSGNTAALSVPYKHEDSRGILRLEGEELHGLARHARRAGYRLAVHAIGDRALDQVLDVYARLFRDEPEGPSHRIEHFGVPTARHLEAARDLRVHVVTQPIFLRELAANFRGSLPEVLLDRCYPFGAMMRAGLSVAFSSDGPVVRDVAPLSGVAAAATAALVPENAVGVADALRAYTSGGAAAQGDEHNRGMLKPGQWADLVVLEKDPLSVPGTEVDRIRVTDVLVGGKPQEVSHD